MIIILAAMFAGLAVIVGTLTWYLVSRYVDLHQALAETLPFETAAVDVSDSATVVENGTTVGGGCSDAGGDIASADGEMDTESVISEGDEDLDLYFDKGYYISRNKYIEKYLSEEYLKSLCAGVLRVGFCAMDLRSGKLFALNEDIQFNAASTTKFAIAMLACDCIEQGILSPEDEVIYYPEYDYEGGSGVLQFDIEQGQALTVSELIDLSLSESDNIALNMLTRKLIAVIGGGAKYAEGLAGILGRYSSENMYTPRELLNTAIYFYDNYERKKSYALIAEAAGDTANDDYVTGRLPDGSFVHKFGVFYDENAHYSCDVGIIRGANPVAFAVMVEWYMYEPFDLMNDLGDSFLSVVLSGTDSSDMADMPDGVREVME